MAKETKTVSGGGTSMKAAAGAAATAGTKTFDPLGSFHKTLKHDKYGEVDGPQFKTLLAAIADHKGCGFAGVGKGDDDNTFTLTNPQAGLGKDRLIKEPKLYTMPSPPGVTSQAAAAEMTELYWMALLRDIPFHGVSPQDTQNIKTATDEINDRYNHAINTPKDPNDPDDPNKNPLILGTDLPGPNGSFTPFTPETLFRLGLPGDDVGPMVSQFFVRPIAFGTQSIDARQRPYKAGRDYLTDFDEWLHAQNSGKDASGQGYSQSNEDRAANYENDARYISTMRDLARFVNKDALHQAYFNAALLMLSGGAKWTQGNPYAKPGPREAGFGVLGGPHILALVSEVATRALKVAWYQKWQTYLRQRPEAYGGLAHVQEEGVKKEDGTKDKKPYGLPAWIKATAAAKEVYGKYGSYLLPMAFSAGSPTHPAYGAGHATVAGTCVTILKAYFQTLDHSGKPIPFGTLLEGDMPYGGKDPIVAYVTGMGEDGWGRFPIDHTVANKLTIEGELNKLAENVAMGRSIGGVHWRTDNTRSLILGEALAAEILFGVAEDTSDCEPVIFRFRTFARRADGKPKTIVIDKSGISIDGAAVVQPPLSML